VIIVADDYTVSGVIITDVYEVPTTTSSSSSIASSSCGWTAVIFTVICVATFAVTDD
jgi:hypothetical protein